jgi:preprotein translocase subunit YajC
MDIVLSNAPLLMAPTGGGGEGGPASILPTLITFGLVFLIFYFLIIRPQNKKQKQQKEMLQSLEKGDRVVTIGGIRGTIQSLKEEVVTLKVGGNSTLEFTRNSISSVLEKKGSSKPKQQKAKQKQVEEDSDEAEAETADTEAEESVADGDGAEKKSE